jgi:signal transduction histidine kinase
VAIPGGGGVRAGLAPGGHGIAGMRERVSLCGGEFAAGPLPGRGFRVAARFPLPGGAR